jgi:divalent metal cation (Fe/Co/Zn/Cd) transporter
MELPIEATRGQGVRTAIRLEVVTISYNVLEGIIAIALGIAASSTSLETFGLDSLIELASGFVLLWRLNVERRGEEAERVEHVERRAARLAGLGLALLAIYVVIAAIYALITQSRPEPSLPGIVLAILSLIIMPVLARLKLRTAAQINSRALHADAYETIVCAYLSATLLLGLGANYVLGWWFADPIASLVMVYFIVREAREALSGEEED